MVSSVAALGAELPRKLRALGEGAVRVTVCVLGVARIMVSPVRGVTSLRCNLLQLVLGEVGEVCRVRRSHVGMFGLSVKVLRLLF